MLVRGAFALASRLRLSPLLIGLTVVGFGTSTPELVTSLQAAFVGSPGIAVGNVVGSNIANVLLILGAAALLAPFDVEPRTFRRDGAALSIATLGCVAIVLWGELSRLAGAVLVAGLVAYLAYAYRSERIGVRQENPAVSPPEPSGLRLPLALFWTASGVTLTVLGARLLVDASIDLATIWGVSDAVIGLTVVAVGTSLPELVTSIVAALRRQGAIAFGNVVGSNIFNILGILGVTALAHPIPAPPEIATLDIWVMLAATVALLAVVVTGWRVTRAEGSGLLAAYMGYLVLLTLGA